MALIRTLLFYLLAYVTTAVLMLIGFPIAWASRRGFSRYARTWARLEVWLGRVAVGVRGEVEGDLPRGQALVVAKHESAYETMALMALLDDPVIVLKREISAVPLFGWMTRRHGVIPVDRTASAGALRTMLAAADDAKAQGRSVLIFPEGTRVPHGERPKLEAGVSGLYARMGLPVVPVATDSGLAWPRGFVKRPGVVRLRFGEPIPAGLPRREFEARLHAAINALND